MTLLYNPETTHKAGYNRQKPVLLAFEHTSTMVRKTDNYVIVILLAVKRSWNFYQSLP